MRTLSSAPAEEGQITELRKGIKKDQKINQMNETRLQEEEGEVGGGREAAALISVSAEEG